MSAHLCRNGRCRHRGERRHRTASGMLLNADFKELFEQEEGVGHQGTLVQESHAQTNLLSMLDSLSFKIPKVGKPSMESECERV